MLKEINLCVWGEVACAWAIGSDIIDNYNIMGISNMLPHYFVGRSVVQA